MKVSELIAKLEQEYAETENEELRRSATLAIAVLAGVQSVMVQIKETNLEMDMTSLDMLLRIHDLGKET